MKFSGNLSKWKKKAIGWNGVAHRWDSDIENPGHYVNFEDGYKKFDRFASGIISKMGKVDSGIDIGCGTGKASAVLAKHVKNLMLLDISYKMLEIAKKKYPKARILYASVTDMHIESECVDIAISRGILISLLARKAKINQMLNEINRVLKPGGAILFDFLSNTKTAKFKAQESYKKAFTKREITCLLKEKKFNRINFDGKVGSRVIRVCARKE
ncbi:class I SAM-dependent methyltransferase [Candidatus Marsarchaeota archaeon]|nr:class I SAM-dependent methyltransferase [Candidatus Marsarchaeota archaeon]MCL5099887.1 class I SAM-dependent methyltransferase [Candidatus Marsarchaeota archaeon]